MGIFNEEVLLLAIDARCVQEQNASRVDVNTIMHSHSLAYHIVIAMSDMANPNAVQLMSVADE